MPHQNEKTVLKIRCSDGRSRKPMHLRGQIVHAIRVPGGILFPDLCADHFLKSWGVVGRLLRRLLLGIMYGIFSYAIKVMIDLKQPHTVIIIAHTPCGAAEALGYDAACVLARIEYWRQRIMTTYPTLQVIGMTESHSECGEEHHGHHIVSASHNCVHAA